MKLFVEGGEKLSYAIYVIEVSAVSKSFKTATKEPVLAVNNVSFQVPPGRIFTILGPNGSGKTTLLRMLSTLLKADSGKILVNNHCVRASATKVRRSIGFLTSSAAMHKKLTPLETLHFFAELQGLQKSFANERIDYLVDKLDLFDFLDKHIGTLSMGQKQRVMIARTLIHDPDVIIFDEATAGLDVLAAKALIDIIKECKATQKTVLFSTHIMGEVAMIADDVMILHKGEVKFQDSFQALKKQQQATTLEEEFIRILEGALK